MIVEAEVPLLVLRNLLNLIAMRVVGRRFSILAKRPEQRGTRFDSVSLRVVAMPPPRALAGAKQRAHGLQLRLVHSPRPELDDGRVATLLGLAQIRTAAP